MIHDGGVVVVLGVGVRVTFMRMEVIVERIIGT